VRTLLFLVSQLIACGGRAIISPDAGDDDGSVASDGARGDAEVSSDANNGLPRCKEHRDCFWGQDCQFGFCCAGTFDGGQCRCGSAPGCTIGYSCCEAKDGFACKVGGCPLPPN